MFIAHNPTFLRTCIFGSSRFVSTRPHKPAALVRSTYPELVDAVRCIQILAKLQGLAHRERRYARRDTANSDAVRKGNQMRTLSPSTSRAQVSISTNANIPSSNIRGHRLSVHRMLVAMSVIARAARVPCGHRAAWWSAECGDTCSGEMGGAATGLQRLHGCLKRGFMSHRYPIVSVLEPCVIGTRPMGLSHDCRGRHYRRRLRGLCSSGSPLREKILPRMGNCSSPRHGYEPSTVWGMSYRTQWISPSPALQG